MSREFIVTETVTPPQSECPPSADKTLGNIYLQFENIYQANPIFFWLNYKREKKMAKHDHPNINN